MNLDALRAFFPVTIDHVFMNHAAESPKSTLAIDAVNRYLADASFGDLYEDRWIRRKEEVRGMAADLIRAHADEVAFIDNVSTGAMLVAQGLTWRPGDNLVTNANQFPANVFPWLNLRRKQIDVRTPILPRSEQAYSTLFSAVDQHTRLIALSFVEYDNGFRYDLPRIGEFCRERDILFFVDAVQGLGAMPLDVRAAGISFLATSGHKWLLGPSGQGFLYIQRSLMERLEVLPLSWLSFETPFDFSNYERPMLSSAARFEGGTSNLMGIAALGAGLELILQTGVTAISQRILALTDLLIEGLARRGFLIDGCLTPTNRSGIVAFRHPDIPTEKWQARLNENRVIVSQRNNHIRLSPHFYNSEAEVEHFLSVLD
ncbi:MAG TPA: aminotransferase class V-fold PLP-dependent enzyme [bacterium]|nr:aminotransferase class V-fold PLP-dependent enzyme [bacterium]